MCSWLSVAKVKKNVFLSLTIRLIFTPCCYGFTIRESCGRVPHPLPLLPLALLNGHSKGKSELDVKIT